MSGDCGLHDIPLERGSLPKLCDRLRQPRIRSDTRRDLLGKRRQRCGRRSIVRRCKACRDKFLDVSRTQVPLAPEHIVTFQNIQGQTIRGPDKEPKGLVLDLFRPWNMNFTKEKDGGAEDGRAEFYQHVYMGLGRAERARPRAPRTPHPAPRTSHPAPAGGRAHAHSDANTARRPARRRAARAR